MFLVQVGGNEWKQKAGLGLLHSCVCKRMGGLLKSGQQTEGLPLLVDKKGIKASRNLPRGRLDV